jgi:hypothetical protein
MRRIINDESDKIQSVVDGMRTRTILNGWLKDRAVSSLGLDVVKVDRQLRSVDIRNVKHYTRKDSFNNLDNEGRWAMSYAIRSSRGAFIRNLRDEICAAAVVSPVNVDIVTITRETMFSDEEMDEDFALRLFNGWEDHVNEDFTGDISVIIDMEDSTQEDVDRMIAWLKTVGAWKLFGIVDGPSASYKVRAGRSTISRYPNQIGGR